MKAGTYPGQGSDFGLVELEGQVGEENFPS